MKKFTLQIPQSYNPSPQIIELTPDEWAIILDSIDRIITSHDAHSSGTKVDAFKQTLETKYKDTISQLQKQLEQQETASEAARADYAKQMARLKKDVETTYKSNYVTTLDSKDAQITALQAELQSVTKAIQQSTEPLRKAIEQRDTQIAALQQAQQKQREALETTYREQLQSRTAELTQAKDEIIATYRQQLTQLTDKTAPLEAQLAEKTRELTHLQAAAQLNIRVESDKIRVQCEELYQKRVGELQVTHRQQLDQQQKQLEKQLEQQRKLEEKRTSERLAQQKEEFLQQYNMQETLMQTLQPVVNFYGGSVAEKGESGEFSIRTLLSTDQYKDAILVDTSGQTAQGDIQIEWRGLRCMIEVKNKAKVTREDVEKFTRDVTTNEKTLNAAIFCSLRTDIIPGFSREPLQLKYISGIPCLFTYMPPPCNELHYALQCLLRITQSFSKDNLSEELTRQLISYYEQTVKMSKYFDTEVKKKQKELRQAQKQLDLFTATHAEISPVYARVVQDADISTEDTDEEPVEKPTYNKDLGIKQFAEEYLQAILQGQTHTQQSLADVFSVPTSVIKSLTMKKIAAEAKLLHLAAVITPDKITRIKEYIEEHQQFPTRKELTDSKTFKDNTLRTISKVCGSGSVVKYIEDYIKSQP